MKKSDDVRKYVVRREIKKGDKTFYKSPKIQRLITEKRLRRKRLEKREKVDRFKASKDQRAAYEKVLSRHIKETKAKEDAKRGKEEDAVKPKELKPAQPKSNVDKTKGADAKKAPEPIKQAQ